MVSAWPQSGDREGREGVTEGKPDHQTREVVLDYLQVVPWHNFWLNPQDEVRDVLVAFNWENGEPW
jgi:hypothetical protein